MAEHRTGPRPRSPGRVVRILGDTPPEIEARVIERDALTDAFYVDADAVNEAVRDRTRFNAIHLETMFKVDIYLPSRGPSGRMALDRASPYVVSTDPERRLVVASAEDTIVHKLHWFRLGDEVSPRASQERRDRTANRSARCPRPWARAPNRGK